MITKMDQMPPADTPFGYSSHHLRQVFDDIQFDQFTRMIEGEPSNVDSKLVVYREQDVAKFLQYGGVREGDSWHS